MRRLLFATCLSCAACSHGEQPARGVTLRAPVAASSAQPTASGALSQPSRNGLLAIAWQWTGDSPGFGRSFYKLPRTVTEGDVTCTFKYEQKPALATTECSSGGRELWHLDETHAFVEDAALLIAHGTLYSARISNISSGCILYAFDLRTGAQRWTTPLTGLGPIDHSEYLNAVELRMIDGRPVVFGWESSGRYIEAVDRTTGVTAFHLIVPG